MTSEQHACTIASNGKLVYATTKDLLRKWDETKESWHDAKTHEFEQRFMNELMTTIDRSLPVFENLNKLIEKIRSDCE
jgi:actin-related protein